MKDETTTTRVDGDLEANQGPRSFGQVMPVDDVRANDDGNSEVSVKQGPMSNSRWYLKLLDAGVEENGIRPVPPEERTQTEYNELFTVFFTCLLCVLPLFFGMIPLLLNAGTVTGFTLIGSIVSGQAIAAVNEGAHISVNVGIGIADVGPATVKSVIGYGSLMAGYFMTFGGTASDFTAYHSPNGSNLKVFTYVYLGLLTPSTPLLILGAAIGGALPNVDSWQTAWDSYGIGGVLAEMLKPAGGFGKFVLVILALSVVGNMVLSNYSVALCLQMLLPIFAKVPRFVFIIVTMAIMIPMAIYAAAEWATSLENFLSLIGYWAGCFDAVVIEELVVFRKMDYTTFDPRIWNKWRSLPPGFAAIGASLVSLALVIPSMDTTWYTGPIGKHIGDLGFESAFVVTALAYYPLRSLEIKWSGRV
ncbi:hypothetical protein G7Z17_g11329 [Cylindrodendrum hubeiense]|uniref:Purine-cytosine permease n=1 Tax=Cylindrodendrum hubeiense TaxID=595255 RepID=A0A9P5GXA5_9HYPO|nr:hypothetical protein G7Z17_g11329 [Cylindrodendrum hubeiense]